MYSSGADQIKEWIIASEKMYREDEDKDVKGAEEEESNDNDSPFDVLEKIRDIVNSDLKDPENDRELNKILKRCNKILSAYFADSEDDEDEDKDAQQDQPQQPPQQPVNQPTGVQTDANPMGQAGIQGMNTQMTPPSGGQI